MKIAILHDYLNQFGGAERVLEIFLEIWPDADVYTLIYNRQALPERMKGIRVHKSFLHKFPFSRLYYEILLPLYPLAVEKIDTRDYDIVISNSSAWVKGALTDIKTCHVTYCLNPMRFVWDSYFPFSHRKGLVYKVLNYILSALRIWDTVSATRPDKYITISSFVNRRIRKYYNIDAEIIHPPVDTDFFVPGENKRQEEYFLLVSRLKPYKRIDIAIKAFNENGLPLVIIGEGSHKGYLSSIAKNNIQFLSNVDDKKLLSYYQRCRALIFPTEEDFGIVPLEAQACGKPVIAYNGGGARETIIDNETGLFFSPQSSSSLKAAVERFQSMSFDSIRVRENALKFSRKNFKTMFKKRIEEIYAEFMKE